VLFLLFTPLVCGQFYGEELLFLTNYKQLLTTNLRMVLRNCAPTFGIGFRTRGSLILADTTEACLVFHTAEAQWVWEQRPEAALPQAAQDLAPAAKTCTSLAGKCAKLAASTLHVKLAVLLFPPTCIFLTFCTTSV